MKLRIVYKCERCQKRFELLMNGSTTAQCPRCHSTRVKPQDKFIRAVNQKK